MNPSSDPARPTVHLSIDVPNLDEGLRFYSDVFGFTETFRPFPAMAVLDANNLTVCVHEKAVGSQPSSETSEQRHYQRHWTPVHMDLHVKEFDDTLNKVRSAGGVIEREFRIEGRRPVAFCSDPFGNGFCVIGERSCF